MLKLKTKQQRAVELASDPNIDTIVLFGSQGTGKTDIAAHIVLSICWRFPKTRWGAFRQNISTANKSLIPSYLDMADRMGMIIGEDFKYNSQTHVLSFTKNESTIIFTEADPSKDRGGKKIKGMNLTGNHIDEADELQLEMFVMAASRKGRKNEHQQPSLTIITMNPNDTWAKEKYYDAYREGKLPKNIACLEFDLSDSWQTPEDIEMLKTNPKWWTERYLFNNWNYSDESNSLFKSRDWAASITEKLSSEEKFVGYDVARSGHDRSVRALIYGKTIADLYIVKDKEEKIDTSEQADWLRKDANENGYGIEKMAVDAVGLGVGVIDSLSKMGLKTTEFMSGARPDPNVRLSPTDNIPINFDSLRSQMIYLYAHGIEKGIIKHFSGCPYLNELQKEAMSHNYEITDKVLRVESKEKIKTRLGNSPDLLDSVIMGLYMALRQTVTRRVYY